MFEHRNPIFSRIADALRLGFAFLLSILLHAAILAGSSLIPPKHVDTSFPEPLNATLVVPLPPPQELIAPEPPPVEAVEPKPEPKPEPQPEPPKPEPKPEPPKPAPKPEVKPAPPPPPRPAPTTGFTATEAARAALRQMAQQPFYPEEAIERGLEGEVLVRLFLDESGNAIAARLERSSGYPILDAAAVRAARAVRSLPEGTPSEVLLPVRFRLR